MTDEEKKVFSLRISQSNKTEIVVISYEIILNYIQSAKECYENGDNDEMIANLKNAKKFVNDLNSNLNLNYNISYDLMNLYRYANKTLLHCIIKKNVEGISSVENIMINLKESFVHVAKQDNRGAAIKGGGQVYAGLTYGNNRKLNEICYTFDKSGFSC